MNPIAFEKLRAEFWDASFVLVPHHSHCIEFHQAFSYTFTAATISRACEKLEAAKRFISKARPFYLTGKAKHSLDNLTRLITDAYCRIAVETSTTGTTYTKLFDGGDDDFFF